MSLLHKKFELDIKKIQEDFDQTNEWVNYYSELFSSHKVINFTYEEFNENAQSCFDSVCDLLKIINLNGNHGQKKFSKYQITIYLKMWMKLEIILLKQIIGNFYIRKNEK